MVSPPRLAAMGTPEAEAAWSTPPKPLGSHICSPFPQPETGIPVIAHGSLHATSWGSRLFSVHKDQREDFVLWPTFPAGPGSTAAQGTRELVIRCVEPLWSVP